MQETKCTLMRREFLNKDLDLSAYIIAIVPEVDTTLKFVDFSPTLEIKDCNRQINLDFYTSELEDCEINIEKIRLLRDIVDSFCIEAEKQVNVVKEHLINSKNAKPETTAQ